MSPHNPMTASRAPSFLVGDCTFKTSRLDEFEDVVSRAVTGHKLSPLQRGSHADCVFEFNGWKELSIFHMGFGRSLDAELDSEAADDRIAFSMAKAGTCDLLWKGRRYANAGQRGVVFTSGPPKSLRFSEDGDAWGVVMNRPRIAAYCAKLLGHEIDGPIEFETEFRLDGPDGESWVRLVRYATGEMSNPLSLVRQIPSARQHLEQLVLTGFLLAHTHNYSRALHQPQAAAAPNYVKRAEAYIEAHFAEPLSLADIAVQAGVGARSLQTGFQSYRNMTPIAFLREVRLRHAHQALLNADPAFATVTDIAISCGFSHMGEFARLYARTYGVSPRHTLQRKLRA